MENKKKILAVIPARGGSKGVHRKNIRLLCGKPLIYWTINACIGSQYIDSFVVSSEDSEIINISENYGAKVIKRPQEFAQDTSSTFDVLIHALDYLKENRGYTPDLILKIQPTSPLRTSSEIDDAIEKFLTSDAESLVSVSNMDHSVFWAMDLKNDYLDAYFGLEYFFKRRQDLPQLYIPNGSIFISTPEKFQKNKGFYSKKIISYVMDKESSIDIDSEFDFQYCEYLMKKRLEK